MATLAQEQAEEAELQEAEGGAADDDGADEQGPDIPAVPQEPTLVVGEEDKVPMPMDGPPSTPIKRKGPPEEADSYDELPLGLRESLKAQRLVDLPKRAHRQPPTS